MVLVSSTALASPRMAVGDDRLQGKVSASARTMGGVEIRWKTVK